MATSLADVYRFFSAGDKSYTLARFRAEWQELTDDDKEHLKGGLESGTYTY